MTTTEEYWPSCSLWSSPWSSYTTFCPWQLCTSPNPAVSSINVWPLPNPLRGELAKNSRDTPYTASSRCSRSPCICEEQGWRARARTVMQYVQCPWSLFLVEFPNSKSRNGGQLLHLCLAYTPCSTIVCEDWHHECLVKACLSALPLTVVLQPRQDWKRDPPPDIFHHCQRSVRVTSHAILLPFAVMVLLDSSWPTLSLSGLLVGHTQQGSLLWSHSLDILYQLGGKAESSGEQLR